MAVLALCPGNGFNDSDKYFLQDFGPIRPLLFDDKQLLSCFKKEVKTASPAFYRQKKKSLGRPTPDGLVLIAEVLERCKDHRIVAMGNLAFYILTGLSPIGDYRGCWVPTLNGGWCLPTYELDEVYATWPQATMVRAHIQKAMISMPRFKERRFSLITTLEELNAWDAAVSAAPLLSIDIETSDQQIDCIGFALSATQALCVPLRRDGQELWGPDRAYVLAVLKRWLLSAPKLLAQNASYEMLYLDSLDININPAIMQDTMLIHHAISPEEPKALEYLAAKYCNERPWKTLVEWTNAEKVDND